MNTLCTPELIKDVCACLRDALPLQLALELHHISYDDYNNWSIWGEKGEEPYSTFIKEIIRAESDFHKENLGFIRDARNKDWKAAECLGRWKSPSNFSKNPARLNIKQQLNVNGNIDSIMLIQNAILEQVAQGLITLEDAKAASAALEGHRRVAETVQIKERVDRIEQTTRNARQNEDS